MPDSRFPHLFSPLPIGPVTARNRVVSSGHDTVMAVDGVPGDQYLAYQEARARGGVGVIVVQVAGVHPSARYTSHVLMADDDSCIPAFTRLAETVHEHGALIFQQLFHDGRELMGPGILAWHYPDNSIVSGSLLTVESNHFCVLKSRGAILNVYDTGQYPVTTPDKPLLGSFTVAFFGGQSPWQYEAIYINRSKMVVKAQGLALSAEMAEMSYEVDLDDIQQI